MVERMDELGIATLVMPTGDIGTRTGRDPFEYEPGRRPAGRRCEAMADA